MKILVCGGRDYQDKDHLVNVLTFIKLHSDLTEIIHGGASGADSLSGEFARSAGIKETVFPADWERYGKYAGPRRNIEMAEQNPDLVVAFPGGKGTRHMIDISKKKGLLVFEVHPTELKCKIDLF